MEQAGRKPSGEEIERGASAIERGYSRAEIESADICRGTLAAENGRGIAVEERSSVVTGAVGLTAQWNCGARRPKFEFCYRDGRAVLGGAQSEMLESRA